jgi:hypothetical protein
MPNPSTGIRTKMGKLARLNVIHYLFSVNKRNKTIAHCLDFDLVASAENLEVAEKRLDTLVRLHIESYIRSNGATGLGEPAPKNEWVAYAQILRDGGALPSSTLRINVPEVVPMQVPYGELEVVSAKAA